MPESTPFHYLAIVRELSYALEGIVAASAFREGLVAERFTKEECENKELANVRIAISRVRGAFKAMADREEDMATSIALRERPALDSIPTLEKLAQSSDTSHLPPDLRP